MPALLHVRELTPDEKTNVQRLAQSRTASARLVQRAKVIWLSYHGYQVAEIADEVGFSQNSVRMWISALMPTVSQVFRINPALVAQLRTRRSR